MSRAIDHYNQTFDVRCIPSDVYTVYTVSKLEIEPDVPRVPLTATIAEILHKNEESSC